MDDLVGKVAFITGAASGMGLTMARSFSAAGMKVVLADIEQEALAKVEQEFGASNREAMCIKLDVTSRDSMEEAAQKTIERFGKVHVLVNNAGVAVRGQLDQMEYQDWDWTLGVNLDGVVNGLQAFISLIKSHGEGGHIVNTASMAGQMALPGIGVYTASKYAVVGISETLRLDLADDNIGVSVLCPGLVDTNIFHSGRNRPAELEASTDTSIMIGGTSSNESMQETIKQGALDPKIVGDMVVKAVLDNEPYIFTHPELENMVEERFKSISSSFEKWRTYRQEHQV